MKTNRRSPAVLMGCTLACAVVLFPQHALGHCDTMDGPVVVAARAALEKGEVTPVLKWVKPEAEAEIKAAFARTLAVRAKGREARDLADQFFFETLVRVHRAGEGAPFTGLKPAGTKAGAAIEEADKSLESGSVDGVIRLVTDEAGTGVRRRFAVAREKKAHADHNVDAGREFVAAYVEYVHYVEGLHQAAQGTNLPHGTAHVAGPAGAAPRNTASEHKH